MQEELLHLDVGVGDHLLNHLLLRQQRVLRVAAERALAHHVERLLEARDRAHGVVDAPTAEPGLRCGKALALAADAVVHGHTRLVEADVAVGTFPDLLARQTDVANDLHPRSTLGHQQDGCAVVDRYVGIGDHDDQQELREQRVGGEPLLPLDHVLVALAPGAALEDLGIGTPVRLCHGEAGHDPAFEQWHEVLLLLVLRTEMGDELRVAGIRRLTAEDARRKAAAAEDLVHERELQLAVALPAQVRRQVARPQVALPHLLLEGGHHLRRQLVGGVKGRVAISVKEEVQRLHLFAHEFVDPVQLFLEFRLGLKVP